MTRTSRWKRFLYKLDDANLDLRWSIIKKAILLREWEHLQRMDETRFFEYRLQQIRRMGEIEGLREAISLIEHYPAKPAEMCQLGIEGRERMLELVKQSYLARDNKLFYWPEDL